MESNNKMFASNKFVIFALINLYLVTAATYIWISLNVFK